VFGFSFLIIVSAEGLPAVFGVVWTELLLGVLVLLELVWDDVVGLDPEADSGGVPTPLNVSFSNGRIFGDALRTTVGSRGGRNMAFDILCMPDTKTDFFLCPSDELICSTMMGCSEANDPISAQQTSPEEGSLTAVGQRLEGRDNLNSVAAEFGR
jgi:hypothetical protein